MGKNMKLSHKQNETAVGANPSLHRKQGKRVSCAHTVTDWCSWKAALLRWP